MNRLYILCLLLSVFCTSLRAATMPDEPSATAKNAVTRLTDQIKRFPQEKLYLQLDKPYYSAGDRLWFRIFMVHASILKPMHISRYVYVELLDAANKVVWRKKIRPTDDGLFFGQMDLSAELPQGWYSIRAYTHFMQNIDEAFFFRKKLYIGNLLKGNTTTPAPTEKDASKPITQHRTNDFDVCFFPEGGALVAEKTQTIGFKALAQDGLGIAVRGKVLDGQNNECTTFKSSHLGMGRFLLSPKAGETYTAVCEDERGLKHTFKLPTVSTEQYALSVKQNAATIGISILSPGAEPRTDTLYLIATLRGIPVLQCTVLPETPEIFLSKQGLHSGIHQILLINNRCEMLSERLIYVFGNDKPLLCLTPDKTNYAKREEVHASIVLKNTQGNPVCGNFSVSVTDDNDVRIDSSETTIESYLLLQSDLKGNIENPNNYFRPENKNAPDQLDLLLLTQGWTRYNTTNTLTGKYDSPSRYEVEQGPMLSGKVQSFPARRGLPKNNVSIFFQNNLHIDATVTDRSGRFDYQSPEFPDSTIIMIQAEKKPGSFVELVITPDSFPKVSVPCLFPDSFPQKNAVISHYLKKSRDRYNFQTPLGIMSKTLQDVVVTTEKIDKNKKIRDDRGAFYQAPSCSFGEEELAAVNTLSDLLMRIPGAVIAADGRSITVRNATPLILVDDMEYTMDELQNINVSDVKLIDVLKEPADIALYGSRGSSCVICVYLKRGSELRENQTLELGRHQARITPLGYSKPAAFYMPKYQVEANRQLPTPDFRTTIYWKPNVETDTNGNADLYFYTADAPGTYTVTAEGVTPDGEIVRYQGKINRK